MKKCIILTAALLISGPLHALCPTTDYTEVDVGSLYAVVVDDGDCPEGFTEITAMSLLLPAPPAGSDSFGDYNAPACSYIP